MNPAQLTHRHRAQQLLVRQATVTQLARIWPTLDWARLDATYPQFAVSVARMVEQNRKTSAGLASQYLSAFRRASGVPGVLKVVHASPLVVDQFNASLGATSIAAIKRHAAEGMPADVAMSTALTYTQGAMARLALDAGRQTTYDTVKADTAAFGFQRVLGGGGCDFCQMLAGRGAVYKADTASFEAHDHCGCTAEPVYRA